jgi:hypothetical protein
MLGFERQSAAFLRSIPHSDDQVQAHLWCEWEAALLHLPADHGGWGVQPQRLTHHSLSKRELQAAAAAQAVKQSGASA